ncbi:MAG: ThuA domain-containing protein [Actinomycetota bacterium]|nr:ThuA domain-containing protein [Actinomycetota bacterium]MDQ3647214.1 ThuA domain-containing protein [Actinomycetota bacterium]
MTAPRLAVVLVVAALAAAVAMPLLAGSDPSARQARVLVISEARGYKHGSVPDQVRFLRTLGRRSRRFDVVHLPRASELTKKQLADSKAVVFASTSGELPIDDETRQALIDFVKDGGALVGLHSASNTFDRWPRFQRLLGTGFRRHPPAQVGRVVTTGRRHPSTRRLPRTFPIRDEFYEFKTSPRRHAHVLLRADPKSISGETRRDLPLAWCRREGRGRVFYSGLGHFGSAWRSDQRLRRLVHGGLRWGLGLSSGPCGRS